MTVPQNVKVVLNVWMDQKSEIQSIRMDSLTTLFYRLSTYLAEAIKDCDTKYLIT